jgi:hypothetical protein
MKLVVAMTGATGAIIAIRLLRALRAYDIDPTNPTDYLWAVPTRCPPTKRCITNEGAVLPLIACYTEEERHPRDRPRTSYASAALDLEEHWNE